MVVKNLATGYEATCVGRGQALRCEASEFGRLKPDRYNVVTSGTFDYQTFEFDLTQTWYCDEKDPASPVSLTATGSTTLPLVCTTEKTHDTTSRTCLLSNNPVAVPLKGTLTQVTPLPPFSIIDPILSPDGCTASSILKPAWRFNYFHVDTTNTTSSSTTKTTIGFNIMLDIPQFTFGFPLSITHGAEPVASTTATEEDESSWYPCVIGPFDPYEERLYPTGCSLKYDPGKKELTIRADWVCSDLDENNPVQFNGLSTSVVDSALVCETVEGGGVVQCVTEDPAYSWVAPISDVTWTQENISPI